MAAKMQQRRGTAAQWNSTNPVLADGEIGFDKDTKIIKVGDGVTAFSALTGISLDSGRGRFSRYFLFGGPN